MSSLPQQTGLVKVESLPSAPLARIEDLRRAFADIAERANLLSPVASVDQIMPMHQVSLRLVIIDPTVDDKGAGPECYRDPRFCAADEVALGKNALAKLMAAAGVVIADKHRLDDRSDPYYCEVEVVLACRDFDGTWRQVVATKEMDLRAGAPETMKPEYIGNAKTGKLVPQQDTALADKRRHISSHAETKAIERGLRLMFALKQKYKVRELQKPFVVPKLVSALDPSDPETKTALIDHALNGEAALFGRRPGRESRTLKDATPKALPAPEAQQIEEQAEPEEKMDAADFEAVPEPQPQSPRAVCTCPCSCQAELNEEVARITTERVGTPRCKACFPGRGFDYARHRELKSLSLPLRPNTTAETIKAENERNGGKR